MMSRTAATSSIATPVLLIRVISRTPNALMSVVKMMRTLPRITAFSAKSCVPGPVADELEERVDLRQGDLVRERDRGDASRSTR